jgi:competence protein ComEC
MWLGMLAAAGGQIPGFPVEAVNLPGSVLLGYIAQVASWCARPGWASVEVGLGPVGLAASYAAIAAAALLARRRPALAASVSVLLVAASGLAVGIALAGDAARGSVADTSPPAGLRVTVLDVGQGDAILFQPAAAEPILVDGGPPGDRLAEKLGAAGVVEVAAAVVTHDQSDHSGGLEELLGQMPVRTLVYAVAGHGLVERATAAGAQPRRIAAGGELRSGRLRLDVLWPPPELLSGPHAGEDPNLLALVIVAHWGAFSMLLTADAEAESTPIDPGPVDVLKVAHHGSDDAGLDGLLERTLPRLAVISVGEDNAYGHPAAATLATLASHGVPTLRTDRDGSVVIEVRGASVEIRARA